MKLEGGGSAAQELEFLFTALNFNFRFVRPNGDVRALAAGRG